MAHRFESTSSGTAKQRDSASDGNGHTFKLGDIRTSSREVRPGSSLSGFGTARNSMDPVESLRSRLSQWGMCSPTLTSIMREG